MGQQNQQQRKAKAHPLTRKQRKAVADDAYWPILKRVNGERSSPAVDRVLWLLEALIRAENLRLELYQSLYEGREFSLKHRSYIVLFDHQHGKFDDPRLEAMNVELRDLLNEITKRLKRYHWNPTVSCPSFLGLRQWPYWKAVMSDEERWENQAIAWLLDHVEQGSMARFGSLILRFSRCNQCGKWFYKTTDHQKSCSAACRQRMYQKKISSTAEGRARHASQVREYRRRLEEMQQAYERDLKRKRR